jgi:Protein of unknown function (DUF1501)
VDPLSQLRQTLTRRQLLGKTSTGLGTIALAWLLDGELRAADRQRRHYGAGVAGFPNFAPKARRVIYLFQSGAPSQVDLFDAKPQLARRQGTDLPESVRRGQRLTGMTSRQDRIPVAATTFRFAQHGQSGATLSELLPQTARVADELCFIKSMHTEAINHDPAVTFFQTGAQLAGRPSIGAWVTYGLGSDNQDLPAFVVMVSQGSGNRNDQPLYDRLWGSGFLPTTYQGVKFRSVGDPVLFLSNPRGLSAPGRRRMLDDLAKLDQLNHREFGDPEILTRIAQYEMAYRMQSSVPELVDLSDEPDSVFDRYGPESRRRGTYAANCLLARRLAERGVRFIQLFHRGWDQHNHLPSQIAGQCRDTDQPSAALVCDLKERGLLEDTLVVWGGEFGRTVYCQGPLSATDYGRDHHPRCFTIWMAGGGIKPGISYGVTDDYSYNILEHPVHVHDLHATMLYCLGIDHTRLTFKHQGRHHRLTDVHGKVVRDVLA